MNKYIDDEKINRYLEDLGEEYKRLLLKRLLEGSEDIEEISISELLRIDSEVKKLLVKDKRKERKQQQRFCVLGIAYIMLGICTYLIYYLPRLEPIDMVPFISLLIIVIGIIVLILGRTLPIMRTNRDIDRFSRSKNKSYDKEIIEYEVVKTWREIEGIVNDITTNSNEKRSIVGNITERLYREGLISDDERIELKKFLKLRNEVVHNKDIEYSLGEIEISLKCVKNIIIKLKKII